MVVLNTPHNPVGKVFTREELEAIASIAKEFNLLVMSDEVVGGVDPGVSAHSDATLTVRLFGIRRRETLADRHPSGDVGEDGYGWFRRE